MKTKTTLMSLLLLSAVCATPALANFFSDARSGTMLNIGSAPNPTAGDLRAIGDSDYAPPLITGMGTNEEYIQPELFNMEGRTLFGAHGERLGTILTVDHRDRTIELQTRGGVAIAVPVFLVIDKGSQVVAPTTSTKDVLAMAKEQTGRTTALEISPVG